MGSVRAILFSSIQTNVGLLYASSLTGDGSQIYNLNAISSSQLTSTVRGLGNIGYISSSQLVSSIDGVNKYISSFIDPTELTSTVVGLATQGYLSTAVSQPNLTSSITGLGTVGYISSTQLTSTSRGLGSLGYISSSQLTSTVTGLGTGSGINITQLTSSITGLGTVGYISSSQLTSTVSGLGSGSAANWATYAASQYVNMNCNSICNINSIYLSNPDAGDFTQLYFAAGANKELYYYDSNFGVSGAVAGSWWQYAAGGTVDFANNNISYVRLLNIYNSDTGDSIDLTAESIYNNAINSSETALIVNNALQINNTLNIYSVSHNPMIQFQNGGDYFTIQAQIDNIGGINTKAFGFSANLNMNSNVISNLQVNYSNNFSNTSIAASLLSASPQTFSGAIYDQAIPNALPLTITTTNAESNYLYFVKNQSMWKIHITMNGILTNEKGLLKFYFTLSNSTSAIETPLTLYTSNNPFGFYTWANAVSINLIDTVNLSDIITSSINPYTPISLNMYCYDDNNSGFISSNIDTWTNPINLSALTIGYGIAYGNNTWIIVGYGNIDDNGYMATSYDNGRTWVGTSLANLTYTAYCVAYGNGIWVIGCDAGGGTTCLLYSTDGTNFHDSGAGFFSQTRGVAYGNGVFVATGSPIYPYPIVYSTDGMHWSPCAYNPSGGGLAVTYANGLFVVVGNDGAGALLTSQNGINWQQYNFATYLLCSAYGAGRWFASDGTGNLYYSTDNWYSYSSISEPYYLASLAFGDTFVGIDGGSGIYSSPDFGTTWNSQSGGFGNGGRGIAYGNGMYVACGDNGDSNCILIASATNTISYSLEPATIQPQYNVLAAPVIDWDNVSINGSGNLVISWFSVPNATHYKIFLQVATAGSGGTHYINKYTTQATVTLKNSLSANMFSFDSGPLTGTSYEIPVSTGDKNNYFVFAYNNGVRSAFPNTQILDWNGIVELWPITQYEYHGGSNYNTFTSVTVRNLYTNQSIVILSNDLIAGTYGPTQLPLLALDTFLSNY